MTTPMQYLHFWFIKNKTENYYSKDTAAKLGSICMEVDRSIFQRISSEENKRDAYLNYFCSFADFNTLSIDLNIQTDQYFIYTVAEIYHLKFPMEKKKLEKMWNLKPKGIIT
jgi:negative regulator of genetic competence, sporulation and motility